MNSPHSVCYYKGTQRRQTRLITFPKLVEARGIVADATLYYIPDLTDISSLTRVRNLHILGCNHLKDLSPLNGSQVESIDLRSCTGITDLGNTVIPKVFVEACDNLMTVNGLSYGVQSLVLSGCRSLTVVQGLSLSLRCVTLQFCPLVKEVHGLSTVPHIALRFCKGIQDISPLAHGKVESLVLEFCNNIERSVDNLKALVSIPAVSIKDCDTLDDV